MALAITTLQSKKLGGVGGSLAASGTDTVAGAVSAGDTVRLFLSTVSAGGGAGTAPRIQQITDNQGNVWTQKYTKISGYGDIRSTLFVCQAANTGTLTVAITEPADSTWGSTVCAGLAKVTGGPAVANIVDFGILADQAVNGNAYLDFGPDATPTSIANTIVELLEAFRGYGATTAHSVESGWTETNKVVNADGSSNQLYAQSKAFASSGATPFTPKVTTHWTADGTAGASGVGVVWKPAASSQRVKCRINPATPGAAGAIGATGVTVLLCSHLSGWRYGKAYIYTGINIVADPVDGAPVFYLDAGGLGFTNGDHPVFEVYGVDSLTGTTKGSTGLRAGTVETGVGQAWSGAPV